jgi:hypothetical protein
VCTGPAPAFPGGSECFVTGTLVYTSEGLKPIEEIQIGDMVLAWSEATTKREFKRVIGLTVGVRKDLVKVYLDDESALTMSSNHRFYVKEKGWVQALEIVLGDTLFDKDSKEVRVKKTEKEPYTDEIRVYNIDVEGFHTYHVGKRGIITHNAKN